jgi:hypothetical protein
VPRAGSESSTQLSGSDLTMMMCANSPGLRAAWAAAAVATFVREPREMAGPRALAESTRTGPPPAQQQAGKQEGTDNSTLDEIRVALGGCAQVGQAPCSRGSREGLQLPLKLKASVSRRRPPSERARLGALLHLPTLVAGPTFQFPPPARASAHLHFAYAPLTTSSLPLTLPSATVTRLFLHRPFFPPRLLVCWRTVQVLASPAVRILFAATALRFCAGFGIGAWAGPCLS